MMKGTRKLFRFFGNAQSILPWRNPQIIHLSAQHFAVSSALEGISSGTMWSFKLASWKEMFWIQKYQGKPDKPEVCDVKYFSLIDLCFNFGLFLLFICYCFCVFIEEIN